MIIHVVVPGDSLWTISNRYGVSVESIVRANQIQNLPHLVVGQALVVQAQEQAYRVLPGDSLWSIAQKFNVTVNSIARLNNISPTENIYPGMILRIPVYGNAYGSIETNGYIEPSTAANERRIVDETGRYLTFISPFSYTVNEDGSLNPINDTAILSAAQTNDIDPLMVITNFRNGNFDAVLAHNILSSTGVQQLLIGNVLNTMRSKGYTGVNIDFERIPPEDRQLYNAFLQRVVNSLRPQGFTVSTALAPKPEDYEAGAWHGAHDYAAHGRIVDFVIIMTYEWGWSGGPPYAVAPINLVEDVLNYAVSVIPPNKIFMGMPLYGYDWPLPYMPGGPWARRVSPQRAIELAAQYGAVIQYDRTAQAPNFNYRDSNGTEHKVWFEDARSVRAKLLLADRLGLRGVSFWVLGVDFPQNWLVLDDMFDIRKN